MGDLSCGCRYYYQKRVPQSSYIRKWVWSGSKWLWFHDWPPNSMVEKQHIANFWGPLAAHVWSPDLQLVAAERNEVHLFKPPDFDETEAQGDGHLGLGTGGLEPQLQTFWRCKAWIGLNRLDVFACLPLPWSGCQENQEPHATTRRYVWTARHGEAQRPRHATTVRAFSFLFVRQTRLGPCPVKSRSKQSTLAFLFWCLFIDLRCCCSFLPLNLGRGISNHLSRTSCFQTVVQKV